jgi:hypothetical protein
VTADPEILSRKLTKEDQYIIVASDGVFEFLTNEEVMDIVHQHKDPFEAASELVELSFKIWLENDDRTDDITAMVFQLQFNGSKPMERTEAQKKVGGLAWGKARQAVQVHLDNRPSMKFRNIVRDAQRKFLRRDKDNHILDQLPEDTHQLTKLASGKDITYGEEEGGD